MKNGALNLIFITLFLLWGYWYPYEWWQKYGLPEISINKAEASMDYEEKAPRLPKAFWGSSLIKDEKNLNNKGSNNNRTDSNNDYAGLVLEEVKSCFREGPIMQVSKTNGDINQFIQSLQRDVGPIQEDLLLEKKTTLTMKDGKVRTLVYEWISPEEGSDLYWHETDEEGFPRPVDLPENIEHDLETFEQLKNLGVSEKVSETRLIQIGNDIQIGIEKVNDKIDSLSIKDDGHLIKCRRDQVKSIVCDCLN